MEQFRVAILKKKPLDSRLKERMYKHFWGYLMGVAMRYVGDKEAACEVVNDSFMKLFKHAERFECPELPSEFEAAFRVWMARITAHTALNTLRKRRILFVYSEDLTYYEQPGPAEDRLEVEDFIRMLDRLPSLHRAVFSLYEIEGYTHEEISQLLGIPAGTSRGYLSKAKERLRTLYSRLHLK
ncbi:RNA polymerase sigma factor [Parapedobacter tibetensis]|uniref:RNA polymerase sigma factor n=1 Tax=Parapedobacter tibetensis TaxID=2972951 RepID=UPI00214DA216|nr:sigma-70 family RNA polymerase sigma factor [Parapedobacter tibetensis]